MDELNGEFHEDFFSPLSSTETEHEYMKEFLMEPSKPSRNMYGNSTMQSQQQQLPPGSLYPANSGICGVPNTNNYSGPNCYESNGALDNNLSLSMHNASGVGASVVQQQYLQSLPSMQPHMPGQMQMGLPGATSRLGMPTNNMNMGAAAIGMPVPPQTSMNMGVTGSGPGLGRHPYSASQGQFPSPSGNVMGMLPGLPTPTPGNMAMHSASSSGMGMHSASPNTMGLHSTASPSGMGMHSTVSSANRAIHSSPSPGSMGIHPTVSPSGMGMHSTASPSGMGMHSSASPGGMGMHSSASPSGMGMHSSASPGGMGMHSSASPGGMGMHSSASPGGMGMHSSASPGGMGMHSTASPSGMGMHSSASPGGMGVHSNPSPAMHSSASPAGMGLHASPSPAASLGMPSPAPSLGKPSASPSRAVLPVASPSMLNIQNTAARSPYRSSPSQFSSASPANIPSVSPGCPSMPSASPNVSLTTTSPLNPQESNGAAMSASCSEGESPSELERLAAERLPSGVTVSVTDRFETLVTRRTPPPLDVLTITPVEDDFAKAGTSGFGKKKDITQVKKVRRKYGSEDGGKSKKRKNVRAQVILSDPHGEGGFGAPSLYDLLTQENPCGEGSLLTVGDGPSGSSNYDFTTATGTVKRGRKRKSGEGGTAKAPPKQRTTVTYQSQISSQNGIKLKIKKSEPVKKPVKQRVRKKKNKSLDSDSDESVHHRKSNHRTVVDSSDDDDGREQSLWATDKLPKDVLNRIFKIVTHEEGCVPFLVRMQRVCKYWRDVAVMPDLWHTIQLCSTWVRDRAKNHHTFRWLCENRLRSVRELNLGGWKFSGIPSLLDVIANNCTELRGLNLTGWQGLHIEHVLFLATNCQKLQRIDLSGVNPEAHNNKGAVSLNSMQNLTSVMGERLTHLVLASNKLAGVPQIITAIAASCSNLEVLDMSNVRTVAHATAQIHIERLQEGCPKLRVLRITNSQFALAPVTIKEQVESPGFPELEELSVASPNGRMNSLATSTPFIDDDAIGRVLKTSHKLRLLDVRGCSRISDSSLVRIPAWDLEHLYLSGCYATRNSGLELITQKWGHSLVELDVSWSTATEALDLAVSALAEVSEKGTESPLRILNLCGSAVSLEPVKAVLLNCLNLLSLNLASCRALPRGMKRNYEGVELIELRSQYLDKPPPPPSPKEEEPIAQSDVVIKSEIKEEEPDSEPETKLEESDEDLDLDLVKSEGEEGEDGSRPSSILGAPQEESGTFNLKLETLEDAQNVQVSDLQNHTLDDSEVMTPEDLQMMAEALANTPEADSIAAEAMAHSASACSTPSRGGLTPNMGAGSMTPNMTPNPNTGGLTPNPGYMTPNVGGTTPSPGGLTPNRGGSTPNAGESTPLAASSTPRSGTYSEAGTPGPPGTLSEAGTPGPSGTFSDAGTPGPSGTESGTPGTPGTGTTSGTTPQQGAEGDGELLALAQDVKYSLENHLNFSFSELDCGGSLP